MRYLLLITFTATLSFSSCKQNSNKDHWVRKQIDTTGFAQYDWQLDSIIDRISSVDKTPTTSLLKAAICPHDDYAYAGGLYYKTLLGIKAKTIVLVGVAHSARNYELKDKVIFGSYTHWNSADGKITISPLRNDLIKRLKPDTYIVHDSMMQLEHSLEAITPFLKRMNPNLEIIPLLVPYMRYTDMETFSDDLSQNLAILLKERELSYGKDVAIVISNDAIHYGNTGWGGDFARFGVDSIGTEKARQKDLNLIAAYLTGPITSSRVKQFTEQLVEPNDYKAYRWTWCGRYSTPFGLLLADKLHYFMRENKEPLIGTMIDYRSSFHNPHIEVLDIGMGHTAPANQTHWVGFTGIGYQ